MDDEAQAAAREDHDVTITFKLRIEDVTKRLAEEFVKRLSDSGEEIEFQLRDGLYYTAVVTSTDSVEFVS